jgi:DNA polymerase III sliding clamp (beta) subunit (PCNA family)
MLHLPCYISSGLLALMLVVREYQHSRITKGLIDKILENRGMTALPESHPVADMLTKLKEEAKEPLTEQQKRLMKNADQRVRFRIPGMPEFK